MKKIAAVCLAVVLILGLGACESKEDQSNLASACRKLHRQSSFSYQMTARFSGEMDGEKSSAQLVAVGEASRKPAAVHCMLGQVRENTTDYAIEIYMQEQDDGKVTVWGPGSDGPWETVQMDSKKLPMFYLADLVEQVSGIKQISTESGQVYKGSISLFDLGEMLAEIPFPNMPDLNLKIPGVGKLLKSPAIPVVFTVEDGVLHTITVDLQPTLKKYLKLIPKQLVDMKITDCVLELQFRDLGTAGTVHPPREVAK